MLCLACLKEHKKSREFRNLSLHLRVHNLTVAEYKKRFKVNGADIVKKEFWVSHKGAYKEKILSDCRGHEIYNRFKNWLERNLPKELINLGHVEGMAEADFGKVQDWQSQNSFFICVLARRLQQLLKEKKD